MNPGVIQFFSEDIDFSFSAEEIVKDWIKKCALSEGYSIEYINIIFCSDLYLLDLNQKHLSHDYFTDIITFQYASDPIEGELFISVDRVTENANLLNVPIDHELHRIIIHGVLHLVGYSDKTEEEKIKMTQKEDFYLSLV